MDIRYISYVLLFLVLGITSYAASFVISLKSTDENIRIINNFIIGLSVLIIMRAGSIEPRKWINIIIGLLLCGLSATILYIRDPTEDDNNPAIRNNAITILIFGALITLGSFFYHNFFLTYNK